MSNAPKKGIGYFATILSVIASLVAGIYYQFITKGYFGLMQSSHKDNYDVIVAALLLGGAALAAALIAIKKYGLASVAVTAGAGLGILAFVHKCYWYVVDVMYGIDEKAFDPKFITFVVMMVVAFVIGEIALYTKKVKA